MGGGEEGKGPTADPWEGGFPVQGSWMSDGGGGEVCCASCKLALERVVSKAFELWNKDPIVMPLTLGHSGSVEAFPLKLLVAAAPVSITLPLGSLPCPLGARTLPVFPSHLTESS